VSDEIWSINLSDAASQDIRQIVRWTAKNFGPLQAREYSNTLSLALKELSAGPKIVGVMRRNEIGRGICTLHVARYGRKGRHFVMFRVSTANGQRNINVLRLLHDSMDLHRHAPQDDPPELLQ
jgi:toxin ParE1/3/4